ncbi:MULTISPECIES: hypothetical protein [unclassified Streptomyces]|uniref:hypothetical protein n=1 Tax=unclassified Streptomyces TaxID=2593676 RepID=UPI00331C0DAD
MVAGPVRNRRRRPGVSCRRERRPVTSCSSRPTPPKRLPCRIDPVDLRRPDLLALLAAAGIAPSAGDRAAIEQLSELPGSVHTALRRWLEQAYGFCR